MEKLRQLAVLLALFGTMIFAVGACGSGGSEFDLLIFEDDPLPDMPSEAYGLTDKEERLVEVSYLYNQLVILESLRGKNRDLHNLSQYGAPTDVDLNWVVEVHTVTAEAEELLRRASEIEVPESLASFYQGPYLAFLELLQVMGFGSDRLLGASLEVGPSGRTLAVMPDPQVEVFERLVRESGFYLREAETNVEQQIDSVEDQLKILSGN